MTKTRAEPEDETLSGVEADLAKRLKRYRNRLEAEGRKRSVGIVDEAIRDVAKRSRRTS